MSEFAAHFLALLMTILASFVGEDSPNWDCAAMGNRECGGTEVTVTPEGIRTVIVTGHNPDGTRLYTYRRAVGTVDPYGRWDVVCDTASAQNVDAATTIAMFNNPTDGTCEPIKVG
jgi:hypothetical protein